MARGEDRRGLVGTVLGHDGREAAAHVEDLPHLGLGHAAEGPDERADGGDRQRVLDRVADAGAQAQQVLQAAAGDVRQAVDREAGAQQVEHGAHVDDGRLEQRVGDAAPSSSAGRASSPGPSSTSTRRASV